MTSKVVLFQSALSAHPRYWIIAMASSGVAPSLRYFESFERARRFLAGPYPCTTPKGYVVRGRKVQL